jgi:hypothetical protein
VGGTRGACIRIHIIRWTDIILYFLVIVFRERQKARDPRLRVTSQMIFTALLKNEWNGNRTSKMLFLRERRRCLLHSGTFFTLSPR